MNTERPTPIYHEKQVKELCALHALNNLYQDSEAFSKAELDSLCSQLSPSRFINPHKSVFGTGNYDVNVLMAAIVAKGCGVVWFDKRKDPSVIILDNVIGLIFNVPSEYHLGPIQLPFKRKHWVALRNVGGVYYNLDSKLNSPQVIGRDQDLMVFLRHELQSPEKELFLVVSQDVETTRSWCQPNDMILEPDPSRSSDEVDAFTCKLVGSPRYPDCVSELVYIDHHIDDT